MMILIIIIIKQSLNNNSIKIIITENASLLSLWFVKL
jgi:hypothetical protein